MEYKFIHQEYLLGYLNYPACLGQLPSIAIRRAQALYRSAHFKAILGQIWARLIGVENRPLSLLDYGQAGNSYSIGIQSVPIVQVRGSEGRCADFDVNFQPLREQTRERWVRIATLVFLGVSLPAVDLIQMSDSYYVRDGNHRISVLRAMGVHFIDAHVTVQVNAQGWTARASLLKESKATGGRFKLPSFNKA